MYVKLNLANICEPPETSKRQKQQGCTFGCLMYLHIRPACCCVAHIQLAHACPSVHDHDCMKLLKISGASL